jgi:hypothetical protein
MGPVQIAATISHKYNRCSLIPNRSTDGAPLDVEDDVNIIGLAESPVEAPMQTPRAARCQHFLVP